MSFVAAINSIRNIATWSRACVSLAGVSDQISFTVSKKLVTMLAVSSSRTTHGEIRFEREFFQEIDFKTNDIMEDGFDGDSYSFVVSSKHLVMLLRNSGPHSLDYVCLRVECSANLPSIRRYKLNVEILTKNLVLKKYQIGFQPVEFTRTDIPTRYESRSMDNDIYRFSIQAAIIKQFLETAHASTEDFRIELKASKIIFTAYTKQVMKDRDYLKQPMHIMISMAVEDLEDSNLEEVTMSLNFRLRDFRNFLSLVSGLRSEFGRIDSFALDSLTFDVLFDKAGDPILFQHKGTDITINFIQMTTDESGVMAKQDAGKYVLHAPVVSKRRMAEPEPAPVTKKTKIDERIEISPETEDHNDNFDAFDAFDAFEPSGPRVTYGERSTSPHAMLLDASDHNARNQIRNHDDDTNNENNEIGENDDTDYSSSETSATEFGPTQARGRPQSLFR
ncbi:hypothetical protein OY671_005459 [Metschnikowia pulcherrima]|nr:hypothetical protein OY671_005459 [Metschnikowia pulcherrima]